MKSTLVLAGAALAVAQDGGYFPGQPSCAIQSAGKAACSSFGAGNMTASSTGGASSMSMTMPPLSTGTLPLNGTGIDSLNITSGRTRTATLGGVTPTAPLTGSVTESLGVSSPNAAATAAVVGAGVLAGVLGVVAAL